MPITAAISAGIGAVGSIGGSLIQSNAASKASNQQVQMQDKALAQQQGMFNQGLGIATNALQPFISAGQSVLPTLQSLLTPGSDMSAALAQTPGFQFSLQYGNKAATNALSARGNGASPGPLATAISQFNQGLAGTTWQSVVNALQGYAGIGANAGSVLGQSALNGAINSGNAQAGTLTNIGNSQAAGTLGSANALAGGVNGVTGSASNALLLSNILANGGNSGIYTPAKIAQIGNMPAASLSDADANAYGIANGLV